MKVLNIEDDAFKHNDICKVLTSCGVNTVYWEKNYEDGWKAIKNAEDAEKPYDLIITDMYYPREAGGREEASGELIIQKVIDQELKVPVILCSSVNLRFSEIFGCVYYNRIINWEDDLKLLINKLAYQNRRRN